jgi:hypothetical protein
MWYKSSFLYFNPLKTKYYVFIEADFVSANYLNIVIDLY